MELEFDFKKCGRSIDVFDAQTLNAVYQDVVNAMTSHITRHL